MDEDCDEFCLDINEDILDVDSEGDNDDVEQDEEFIEQYSTDFTPMMTDKAQWNNSPRYTLSSQRSFNRKKSSNSAPVSKFKLRARSISPKLAKTTSYFECNRTGYNKENHSNRNNNDNNPDFHYESQRIEEPEYYDDNSPDEENQFDEREVYPNNSSYTKKKIDKCRFQDNESTLRKIIREVIIERDKKRYESYNEILNKKVFSKRRSSQSELRSYISGKSSPMGVRDRSISPRLRDGRHFGIFSPDRYHADHFQWKNGNYYSDGISYSQTELGSRVSPQQLMHCQCTGCWNSNKTIILESDKSSPTFNAYGLTCGDYAELGVQEIFDRVRLLEESENLIHSPRPNPCLPSVAEESSITSKMNSKICSERAPTRAEVKTADEKLKNNSIEVKLDALIDALKIFIDDQKNVKNNVVTNTKEIEEKIRNEISKALIEKRISKAKSESVRSKMDAEFMKSVEKILVTESELKVNKNEIKGKCREYKYEFSKNKDDQNPKQVEEPEVGDSVKKVEIPTPRNYPGKFQITVDFNVANETALKTKAEINKNVHGCNVTKENGKHGIDASTNTDPYSPDLTVQYLLLQSLKKFLSLIPSLRYLIPVPNFARLMSENPRYFPCEKCGKDFRRPSEFVRHIISHGNASDCPACQSTFSSNGSFVFNKGFQCPFCGETYMTANCRKIHEAKCPLNMNIKVDRGDGAGIML